MASQHGRGWTWNKHELEWMESWKPKVVADSERVLSQVACLGCTPYASAPEIERFGQQYLRTAEALLALAGSGSDLAVLPISPRDAARLLLVAGAYLARWSAYVYRSDVQQALQAEAEQAFRNPTEFRAQNPSGSSELFYAAHVLKFEN